MDLRAPGHGYPSPQKGAAPGDLLVVIRGEPDTRLERHGDDLWRSEAIDVTDAALGATLQVPTLDGEARVTVPAGTQPDTVLRMAGKGLPNFQARGHGHLYVRIGARVPDRLSAGSASCGSSCKRCGEKQASRLLVATLPPQRQAEAAICQNLRGGPPHRAAA